LFNINEFKSNGLVYGGARPSLFQVFLTPPAGIGIDNVSATKFSFSCRAASLPAMRVSSIDVPYFGRKIRVAGERDFDSWNVSIMNDEDFAVRSLFETWSNAMNRIISNVRDPNVDQEQYKTDLAIEQYGKDGEIIRSYAIVGAFPTEIGSIDLSWDDANSIEQFPVSFAYDWFEPIIETSSKKAGGVNTYGPATGRNTTGF